MVALEDLAHWCRPCCTPKSKPLQLQTAVTSSEGCHFALLIEGVGKTLGGSQHLLMGWLESLPKELERSIMCCSYSGCEPDPTRSDTDAHKCHGNMIS